MRTIQQCFILLFCTALLAACTGKPAETNTIKIGTSEPEGSYYLIGAEFAAILEEEKIADSVTAEETPGSSENIRLLSDNKVQVAFSQADILYDAYQSEGMFDDAIPVKGFMALAALFPEAVHIIVRAEDEITAVNELQEKTVCVGILNSGTEQNTFQILLANGIDAGSVTTVNMTTPEAAEALKNKTIDAFFCTAGDINSTIAELAEDIDIRILSMNRETIQELEKQYPYYFAYTIPEDTYHGQEEPVETVAVKSVLIARDSLPDDLAEQITASLFQNESRLQASVPVSISLREEEAVRGVPIPFHNGAVKYYEAAGIAVPDQK